MDCPLQKRSELTWEFTFSGSPERLQIECLAGCPIFRGAKGGIFSPSSVFAIVGSEEARGRAGLRPPPKLHRRICRMQLSRRLNETRGQEKESKQPSAQARTRRKAGTQAAVSSHACANA